MSKKKDLEKTKQFEKEELDKIEERMDDELEKGNPTREELESKIEEITDKEEKNKKLSVTLIVLLAILLLACIFLVIYLVFIRKEEPKNEPIVVDTKIERPSEEYEYTIIKQNTVSFICNKTKDGEKFKELKKGLIIDCEFKYQTPQKISELYFDLGNSSNIKLKEYSNKSDYTIETDNTTYKLTTSVPAPTFNGELHFYYQVTDANEKTGYLEIKNIVFKDDNNGYYKMINNMITFPPEYNDKVYIYKDTYEEEDGYKETFYFSSKVKYNIGEDEEISNTAQLIDTFQCKNETCAEYGNYENYFIIYDDKLILYDVLMKTTREIRTEDKFDPEGIDFELMINENNNPYGMLFKKAYVSNYNCNISEYSCIETSISGYEVGYYSFDKDMFTVAQDYGFIGSSVYDDYDKVLMLKKDNKFGIFSYETDSMVLEMTSKYTAIQQAYDLNAVKLELYDSVNKQNYYTYFNYNNNTFKLNISNLTKFNASSDLYYVTEYNRQNNLVAMLYNAKGEQLTALPYVIYKNIVSVTDKIVLKNVNLYDYYDLKGNKLFSSKFTNDKIVVTESYILAANENNNLEIDDKDGNLLKEIADLSDETMEIVKYEETDKVLTIYVKDTALTEEGKNGYIYTYNNGNLTKETAYIE